MEEENAGLEGQLGGRRGSVQERREAGCGVSGTEQEVWRRVLGSRIHPPPQVITLVRGQS